MRKILIVLVSLLLAGVAFADTLSTVKGPHATVMTDGSQADGSVNLLTNNAGPICFSTNKVKRQCVPSDSAGLVAPTADGADSGSFCLDAGGACSATRGAGFTLYGNEHAEAGEFRAYTGNGGGPFVIYPEGDSNRHFDFNAASDTAHTLTFGDGGTTALQTFSILASTSDGDDDSYQEQCGGGSGSAARGGCVKQFGNEYGGAGAGGEVQIIGGDGSGGSVTMRARGDTNRQLKFDAASDTGLQLTFGDGGTTASQAGSFLASTGDADDDSIAYVCGGGACTTARGAFAQFQGEQAGGSATIATSVTAGNLSLTSNGGSINNSTGASGFNRLNILNTGEIDFLDMVGNGAARQIKSYSIEKTGMSGASVVATNLIPAKSTYLGCVARVTTLVAGSSVTSWNFGDGSDADRWGATVALAAGTVTTQANFTAAPGGWSATAISPTLTPVGGASFSAGAVRITCFVEEFSGPTS